MPAVSSLFLILALGLAVVIGPQTRAWSWGPAMLALGISIAASLPGLWKRNRSGAADLGVLAFATTVAAWFAWRAWESPVRELGVTDLLLLLGCIGAFICVRGIIGNKIAERIFIWGIALLLFANVVVVLRQVMTPSFTPVFEARAAQFPAGFFAHYNEAANFLICCSLILGAAAILSRYHLAVRVIWGLIAVAGLVAVYYTRSRGGIFGAALGSSVLACGALVIGHQKGAKWFAPALIAIPMIGLGLVTYLFVGWEDAQELRQQSTTVAGMFDNTCRLYFLGMAISCVSLHPFIGGGSQSFSWECFRFANNKLHGNLLTHRPDKVHNEFVQALTDYGIIGAGLLAGLLATLAIIAILRIFIFEKNTGAENSSFWRIGGLAALAGMLVQSSFSFVFHLFPGVLLLGFCLAQMSFPFARSGRAFSAVGTKLLVSVISISCILVTLSFGWKGTQVTQALWLSYLSKIPITSLETRIEALDRALTVWPQSSLFMDRAALFQARAAATELPDSNVATEFAVKDYLQAEELHSFDPSPAVNRGNLLSYLGKDSEAENAFNRAILLQGGMEPAFRSHFSKAKHLLRKGNLAFDQNDPASAWQALESSADEIELAAGKMHWLNEEFHQTRALIHEGLGVAREANGDLNGALAAYEITSTLRHGAKAHYRIAALMGKMAANAWTERRASEAMAYFTEARRRTQLTQEVPSGVTLSQRVEYIDYLDKTIGFLKAAKIEPATLPKN